MTRARCTGDKAVMAVDCTTGICTARAGVGSRIASAWGPWDATSMRRGDGDVRTRTTRGAATGEVAPTVVAPGPMGPRGASGTAGRRGAVGGRRA
mmetsp:Transcript_118354/g.166341  ORF Transcript_118354/g.166341 Transcript_118354/m.166341 type:complete len:95 (-) Transcript_118354:309-593(-)